MSLATIFTKFARPRHVKMTPVKSDDKKDRQVRAFTNDRRDPFAKDHALISYAEAVFIQRNRIY